MSYCRWSSFDFACDIYAYEDVHGGITIHVAKSKVNYAEPLPPPIAFDDIEAWMKRSSVVDSIIGRSEFVPIGGPHDGETYSSLDYADAVNTLFSLKQDGYRFPLSIIDAIVDEFNVDVTELNFDMEALRREIASEVQY